MRRQLVTIDATASLAEVERTLFENRIGGAPVVDRRGTILGVISLRDLVEHYTEDPDARPKPEKGAFYVSTDDVDEEELGAFEKQRVQEETAEEVMTASVHSIDADANLQQVAATMLELQIHRILVTEAGKTVGLISTMDLLRAMAGVVGKTRARKPAASAVRGQRAGERASRGKSAKKKQQAKKKKR
jgi:CBS domain-containing protein